MNKINANKTHHIPTDNNMQADQTKLSRKQQFFKAIKAVKDVMLYPLRACLGPLIKKLSEQKSAPKNMNPTSSQGIPGSLQERSFFSADEMTNAEIKNIEQKTAGHKKSIRTLEKLLKSRGLSSEATVHIDKQVKHLEALVEENNNQIDDLKKQILDF